MTKHACIEIGPAAIGIDQGAVVRLGHRIDGQVAPAQVLLERYIRRSMEDKAVVAAALLPLGAGERIFLVRLGMQEDGEIPAHRLEAERKQLFRGTTDDHMIAVADAASEQLVSHRAADAVRLHGIESTIARSGCEPGRSGRARKRE